MKTSVNKHTNTDRKGNTNKYNEMLRIGEYRRMEILILGNNAMFKVLLKECWEFMFCTCGGTSFLVFYPR